MQKLEHIVWPHVRLKIEERIDEITNEHQSSESTASNNSNNNIIIVEAALLLETNWHDLLDGDLSNLESVGPPLISDDKKRPPNLHPAAFCLLCRLVLKKRHHQQRNDGSENRNHCRKLGTLQSRQIIYPGPDHSRHGSRSHGTCQTIENLCVW